MTKQDKKFVAVVWNHYHEAGRHTLPWRHTDSPFHILVSEIMLQQTQVDRVIPKYLAFVDKWPDPTSLASAPLSEVLRAWQGLGYNRRAKMLHECATVVTEDYEGVLPNTYEALRKLPGVGTYTAAAVMAFAYGTAVPMIETNIRTVYFHHYYNTSSAVTDAEVQKVVARTQDADRARDWYYALMDYGSYLKRTSGARLTNSKHHKKQAPFKGSTRQLRGTIVRLLSEKPLQRTSLIAACAPFTVEQVEAQLAALQLEGLVVVKNKGRYSLPD